MCTNKKELKVKDVSSGVCSQMRLGGQQDSPSLERNTVFLHRKKVDYIFSHTICQLEMEGFCLGHR